MSSLQGRESSRWLFILRVKAAETTHAKKIIYVEAFFFSFSTRYITIDIYLPQGRQNVNCCSIFVSSLSPRLQSALWLVLVASRDL